MSSFNETRVVVANGEQIRVNLAADRLENRVGWVRDQLTGLAAIGRPRLEYGGEVTQSEADAMVRMAELADDHLQEILVFIDDLRRDE